MERAVTYLREDWNRPFNLNAESLVFLTPAAARPREALWDLTVSIRVRSPQILKELLQAPKNYRSCHQFFRPMKYLVETPPAGFPSQRASWTLSTPSVREHKLEAPPTKDVEDLRKHPTPATTQEHPLPLRHFRYSTESWQSDQLLPRRKLPKHRPRVLPPIRRVNQTF